ncbi:FAD-binding domain-containing protein [Daldinia caldariorum]|uniref:FAD-binding domain-containing protein n=1 Tax=Daldinia caldariorum TaxID=326644 RepID=UPI002008BC59|nr:FAD-binding domain-containing protein [Daldinia caldariorum]KAI1470983.1 FAD-binding domain-containing protein [Daldinia caldariorum]
MALVFCFLAWLWATPILGSLSQDLLEIASNGLRDSRETSMTLISQIEVVSSEIDTAAAYVEVSSHLTDFQRASAACIMSELIFPGRVLNLTRTEYKSEQYINWSATCWLPAACFVILKEPAEVGIALRIITETQSKFSVRGGGHNPNPGFSSIEDYGVLLDLKGLKMLSLTDNGLLQAGPGNTWRTMYDFTEGHGRAVKGARVQHVGIPGYLLGGGLVFFPSLHGLAVDSIENYEIVLANSTIVNANSRQNKELFIALKGGGANFGIVTRFDILTYPAIHVQYSLAIYNATDYANILNATIQVQEQMEVDPKIDIFLSVTPTVITVGLLYADWLAQPPSIFDTFFALDSLIGYVVELTNGSIGSFEADMDAAGPPYDARRLPSTVSTTYDYDFYIQVHEMFLGILQAYPHLSSANISYTLAPLASTAVLVGKDRGGNSLGLDKDPQTWWSFVLEWADAKDDTNAQQLSEELLEGLQSLAQDQNHLLNFHFMNHASFTQNVLGSYGTDNVKRLESVAKSLDPSRIFQDLQNDGFLLRKL